MKLRRTALAVLVALGLAAPGLTPPADAQTVPGQADLEVTVTGTYGGGLLGAFPGIEWTITLANSVADFPVATSATGVVVRDTLSSFTPSTPARTGVVAPSGTSYNAATGTWSVPSLPPGVSLSLRYQTNFGLLSSSTGGTVSAEVTAQAVSDLDSKPAEDADIGNEDDEAIWRTGAGNLRQVGDRVWSDLNVDGRYAAGEPGIRGVPVIVTSPTTGRIFAGRTDASGVWSYTAVPSGTKITTRFVAPRNFVFTPAKVGDDIADSDADQATGVTAERTIGSNDPNIDAGFRPTADLSVSKSVNPTSGPATLTPTFTVVVVNRGPAAATGVVLADVFPAGSTLETGSVSISQGSSSGRAGRLWSIGTLPSGGSATLSYRLSLVTPGTFQNRAQITASNTPDPDSAPDPASTPCTANNEDDCATATAVATPGLGTLAGVVWLDSNGDGQRQSSEPLLSGVTVRRLTVDLAIQASTTSNSNGAWHFAGVTSGSYVVEVVAPAGAELTLVDVGLDLTDSDFPASGRVPVVVSTGTTTSVDAGFVQANAAATDSVLVPQGVSVTFNVLDNDAIPGRPPGGNLPSGWSWNRVDGAAWGSVTCQLNGSCTYLPLGGYAGPDSFRYSVRTPLGGITFADVRLDVLFVNDPPVARVDRVVTGPEQPVLIPVLANDEDPNDPALAGEPNRPGDPLTVTAIDPVSPSGAGRAECSPVACTFTPVPGFTGTARFGYTVTDTGRSDQRVAAGGVPGGIDAKAPRSASSEVHVWVDPARRPRSGFTAAVSRSGAPSAGTFLASVDPSVSASCVSGRPQVKLEWQAAAKATGYRIERTLQSGNRWVVIAVLAAPATTFADALVGESQVVSYRVTPLRYRLAGQSSPSVAVTPPPTKSPEGC